MRSKSTWWRRVRGLVGSVAFFGWFGLCSVVVGTLMVGHWVTLPKPDSDDAQLRAALEGLRQADAELLAVHVLYADCQCSRRIFDHLLASERPAHTEEVVLLVGSAPEFERGASDRGIRIHRVTPLELKVDFHIESAPLLAVLAPKGVAYLGGYTERKQGPAIQDVQIISRIERDAQVTELPLFGCGVSAQLQAMLDPLGVKYAVGGDEESP